MATQRKPLWIDPFENRLYAGLQSTQLAEPLVFKQGDEVDVELLLLKRSSSNGGGQELVNFPSGCTVRVAIGKIDAVPTGGTMTIQYGANTTGDIDYDATDTEIATALNGLTSIISAGGVSVVSVSTNSFRIAFTSVGVRTGFITDTAKLTPTSSTKVIELRAGTSTLSAVYLLKVKQSAVVYQGTWTDSETPSLTVTTLVSNRTKRVVIDPLPLSGTWSLLTTANIDKKVQELDAGELTNVATYWTQTATQRWGAFQTDFNYDGLPLYQMGVVQIDTSSWDFTVLEDYAIPGGYTMPFTVSGNFTGFPSKVGTLNFNTVEVEYLLNGEASATAILEVEIEQATGERWTILQTTCTIVNDLIDQVDFDPLTLDACITEAPVDGIQYVRKDGSWQTLAIVDGGTY